MSLKGHFPILIAHRDVGKHSVAGVRLQQIQHELEANGWKTLLVDNEADAGIIAGLHRGLAAIVFRAEVMQKDASAGARLIDVAFERCELGGAVLSNVSLERVSFRGCDLLGVRGADALRGAQLTWDDVLANAPTLAAALGIELLD